MQGGSAFLYGNAAGVRNERMSEECTHDCSSCGAACSSRNAAPQHDAPNPNSSVKKVIGVVSGKGGVGKSMTSALLACAMARRGYHCGVLDADITGPSIPKLFGIHGRAMADAQGCWPIQSRMGIDVMSINLLVENEEDPVVWRGPVIAGAVKQFWTDVVWKDVDFLFVDMPPGTGDVPLTVFQSLPVDGIVVVASPQELVSMIVAKAVNMAEMMKVPMLGLVENMSYVVCPDCGKHINVFGDSHVDEVAAKHGLPVLAKCPIDPELARLSDAGLHRDLRRPVPGGCRGRLREAAQEVKFHIPAVLPRAGWRDFFIFRTDLSIKVFLLQPPLTLEKKIFCLFPHSFSFL